MSKEAAILIGSVLITAGVTGGGFWWLSRQVGGTAAISQGETLILTTDRNPNKERAAAAVAQGQYPQAIAAWEASLQQNPNDPEAVIFANNARLAGGVIPTLAVVVPATTATTAARELLRGVAQAQQELNANSRLPFRVAIANDENKPDLAKAVAAQLVQDSTVLGVIGHFGSEASLAAAPIYTQAQLPMISATSTSTQLSTAGSAVLRTVPSDRFTAEALARYALNTLKRRRALVLFNADSAYSQSLKTEFTTALAASGGQALGEINLAAPDFQGSAVPAQAQRLGADFLVLLPNTATLEPALTAAIANAQGPRLPVVGGDSVYNPKTLEIGGAAARDLVVAVPWHIDADPTARFVESSRRQWRGDVNWRTALAYDAVQAWHTALGLTLPPTRSGLVATLRTPGFQAVGATGLVRFLPSGDRNRPMQLVRVVPGNRSGFGFDFVPVP
ncbi:MAG TPA: receptor ligand binding family protein [Cyanobacteria bacterium UBA8156]|jgi:branched-chain amino acid transport system substrate-binding protein|nr:receptor ligand binding family protein [Cyanobacteria bacterium UBA8156]